MASLSPTGLPSPAEYREFAVECLRWADRGAQLDQRSNLIKIASDWMHIASSIERNQAKERLPRLRLSP
jgi:hypothetical protein